MFIHSIYVLKALKSISFVYTYTLHRTWESERESEHNEHRQAQGERANGRARTFIVQQFVIIKFNNWLKTQEWERFDMSVERRLFFLDKVTAIFLPPKWTEKTNKNLMIFPIVPVDATRHGKWSVPLPIANSLNTLRYAIYMCGGGKMNTRRGNDAKKCHRNRLFCFPTRQFEQ